MKWLIENMTKKIEFRLNQPNVR